MHAREMKGTPNPLPNPDIVEAAEPNFDADSIATFDKVKATQVNEPAQKQTPTQTAKATSKPAGRASATVAEEVVAAIKPLLAGQNQTQEIDADDAAAAARFDAVKSELNGEKPAAEKPAVKPEAKTTEDEILGEILNRDPSTEDALPEPPENLSDAGKATWNGLRERAVTYKTEIETLRGQLTQVQEEEARREAIRRENELADANYDPKISDEAFEKAAAQAAKELLPFREVPGADKWNAQAAQLRDEARAFYEGQVSLEDAAHFAHLAVGARAYAKLVDTLSAKLNSANAQIARLTVSQPTAGDIGGERPETPMSESDWSDPQNTAARFEKAMAAVRGG